MFRIVAVKCTKLFVLAFIEMANLIEFDRFMARIAFPDLDFVMDLVFSRPSVQKVRLLVFLSSFAY